MLRELEVFNISLSNAVNASATDTGVVTILDDDSSGGGACGDPGYDRLTERELFIWQDCAGDGTWYVRATSGGWFSVDVQRQPDN